MGAVSVEAFKLAARIELDNKQANINLRATEQGANAAASSFKRLRDEAGRFKSVGGGDAFGGFKEGARAAAGLSPVMLQNEAAILRAEKALAKVRKITEGQDFGAKSAKAAAGSYRELAGEMSNLMPGSGFAGLAGGGVVGGVGLLASGFLAAAKAGVEYRETIDRLSKSFTTLLGSERAAASHLKELEKFAADTPFEFEDVARASQRFQNMGLAAKDVIPLLKATGNAVAAAGGGSEQIDRVTLALAQMGAKGKVSQEELNQLAENGVGGLRILEQQTGKSKAELIKMAEAGQISAETFLRAFRKAYEGGNAMQKQMETLSGAASTLKDTAKQLLGEGFTPMHGTLRDIAVDLAKITTEGWSAQRSLISLASATKNAFEAANPGLRGVGGESFGWLLAGLPGAQAIAAARGVQMGLPQNPQKFGDSKGGINIPDEFKYDQAKADATYNASQVAGARAFVEQQERAEQEAERKRGEARRKAESETARQVGVVKSLTTELARATIQNEYFGKSEVEQTIATARLTSGIDTLTGNYRKLASITFGLWAMQTRTLDVKKQIKEEDERQTRAAKELSDKQADYYDRVRGAFDDLLGVQQTEQRKVNDLIKDGATIGAIDVRTAKLMRTLAVMKDMADVAPEAFAVDFAGPFSAGLPLGMKDEAGPFVDPLKFTRENGEAPPPPKPNMLREAWKEFATLGDETTRLKYAFVDLARSLQPQGQAATGKRGFWSKLLGVASPFLSLIPGVGPILSAAAGMASGALAGNWGAVAAGAAGALSPGGAFRSSGSNALAPSLGSPFRSIPGGVNGLLQPTPPVEAPRRALGGPVERHRPYIIRDRGPRNEWEVFEPVEDGFIHPSVDSYLRNRGGASMSGGGSHGGGIGAMLMHVLNKVEEQLQENAEHSREHAAALRQFRSMPPGEVVMKAARTHPQAFTDGFMRHGAQDPRVVEWMQRRTNGK